MIAVNVDIPEVEVGPVNVGIYYSAPADLPDGTRTPLLTDVKGRPIIVVYGDVQVDHRKIKGTDLKDPTVAASIPMSIENEAIAYDVTLDLFKCALYYDGTKIDPRAIRSLTSSDIVTVVQDTPGSHLIRVYGNTVKDGSGTDYALLVDADGKLVIRPLTSADVVTVADVAKIATPATGEATNAGNTEIITVSAGKKLRIKSIDIWNNGADSVTVALRFTATGTLTYKKKIASESGWIKNLIGCNWEGGVDEDLFINLSGAGTVSYTITKEEI